MIFRARARARARFLLLFLPLFLACESGGGAPPVSAILVPEHHQRLESIAAPLAPVDPKLDITIKILDVTGQARDFRPEGASKGIFDAYEGQTVTMEIRVHNDAKAKKTDDGVILGYRVETPFLKPLHYDIYTDWPAKDQKTWKINDSNTEKTNPPHDDPPATGQFKIYVLSPGETKKVVVKLHAAQYSIGAADHPDLRAWVWHVANYYGEQTAFNDKVEHNDAGKMLQAYAQTDVYSRVRWEFNAGKDETEGWSIGHGVDQLFNNTAEHCLAAHLAGGDPYIVGPETAFDAGKLRGVRMRVRAAGGPVAGRLYFATAAAPAFSEDRAASFAIPGGGTFQEVGVSLDKHAAWAGTITRLRIDPAPVGQDWVDLDWVRVVDAVDQTSGDADGDGHVAAPAGDDCDDADAKAFGGAPELCDGKDNNCDGQVDEGFDLGVPCDAGSGLCESKGLTICSGNHKTTYCKAVQGPGTIEYCDGIDNDCDGKTDEDFPVNHPCTVASGPCAGPGLTACGPDFASVVCRGTTPGTAEKCDGVDNDCDGLTDEGFALEVPCAVGFGACAAAGVTVCGPEGTIACGAIEGSPSPEACDGKDNDCDGLVDEDFFDLGFDCLGGEGGCKAPGQMRCAEDRTGTVCVAPGAEPGPEACDGLDNDCDGLTDEDFDDIGNACGVGIGACRVVGLRRCAADGQGTTCDAEALPPGVETCNGVDDDCDGTVDQGVCGACTTGEAKACTMPDGGSGTLTCGPDGKFGDCRAPGADEGAPDVQEEPDLGVPGPDRGSDTKVPGKAGGGCAAGTAAGPAWVLLLAAWIHGRRRR